MQEQVLEALKSALEITDRAIELDDAFQEFDEWDSLAQMSLIAELDERFGVAMETAEFSKVKTVRDLICEISGRK